RGKMLGVACRAAVATGQDLAAVEQALDHALAGGKDGVGQYFCCLHLRFDTFGKQLSYALQAHRSFSVESIFNPDGRVVAGAHRNYIKAAWLVGASREARQVMPGGQHQAPLLALVERGQRAAEAVRGTRARPSKPRRGR